MILTFIVSVCISNRGFPFSKSYWRTTLIESNTNPWSLIFSLEPLLLFPLCLNDVPKMQKFLYLVLVVSCLDFAWAKYSFTSLEWSPRKWDLLHFPNIPGATLMADVTIVIRHSCNSIWTNPTKSLDSFEIGSFADICLLSSNPAYFKQSWRYSVEPFTFLNVWQWRH